MELEQLQYPVGRFLPKPDYTQAEMAQFIDTVEKAPAKYRSLVENLTEADFKKTYREGAWNIRQLVHHIADMQILHLHRFKVTLTEDNPQGTVVNINGWANTNDALNAPIEPSLMLFEGTHARLTYIARHLSEDQWQRSFHHSTRKIDISLKQAIYMSAWHVEHHYAHIKIALKQ
jgi:hypothetical protein